MLSAVECNKSPENYRLNEYCPYDFEDSKLGYFEGFGKQTMDWYVNVLKKKIDHCVEVKGSDEPEYKAQASLDFADGSIHALVSKPSIFGFGSNFQSCHNMVFCGLSDSYERFYQAIRRCWRFGQKEPVNVYIILSEKEMNVLDNITRKQAQMDEMQKQMTALMKDVTLSEIKHTTRITTNYNPEKDLIIPGFLKGA